MGTKRRKLYSDWHISVDNASLLIIRNVKEGKHKENRPLMSRYFSASPSFRRKISKRSSDCTIRPARIWCLNPSSQSYEWLSVGKLENWISYRNFLRVPLVTSNSRTQGEISERISVGNNSYRMGSFPRKTQKLTMLTMWFLKVLRVR